METHVAEVGRFFFLSNYAENDKKKNAMIFIGSRKGLFI